MLKNRLKTAAERKRAAQKREDAITNILDKVSSICNYAIMCQCTEQSQFEELEWMLRKAIR